MKIICGSLISLGILSGCGSTPVEVSGTVQNEQGQAVAKQALRVDTWRPEKDNGLHWNDGEASAQTNESGRFGVHISPTALRARIQVVGTEDAIGPTAYLPTVMGLRLGTLDLWKPQAQESRTDSEDQLTFAGVPVGTSAELNGYRFEVRSGDEPLWVAYLSEPKATFPLAALEDSAGVSARVLAVQMKNADQTDLFRNTPVGYAVVHDANLLQLQSGTSKPLSRGASCAPFVDDSSSCTWTNGHVEREPDFRTLPASDPNVRMTLAAPSVLHELLLRNVFLPPTPVTLEGSADGQEWKVLAEIPTAETPATWSKPLDTIAPAFIEHEDAPAAQGRYLRIPLDASVGAVTQVRLNFQNYSESNTIAVGELSLF